jgi:prephenate dehydrogenase
MNLLVVGAGAMGRWFAATVQESVPHADIAFTDTSSAAAAAAASTYDARAVPVAGDEAFDAVCLAVPISVVEGSIVDQASRVREAVVDVTGVMAAPLATMRRHCPDHERVSFHPLFAPENAPGHVATVVDEPGPTTDQLRAALSATGNTLFETTAAEHDRAMETVQASAHTAVLAYALAAESVRPEFHTPVSAALEEVVDTVTGGTPRVYREIQSTFDGAERVADAAARIASADDDAFEALYREAGQRAGHQDTDGADR